MLLQACSEDTQDVNEERLQWISSLFTGVEQHQNFNRAYQVFPTTQLAPSSTPLVFDQGSPSTLPEAFNFQGEKVLVEEFLSRTDTSALLILHNSEITYENYWLSGGEDVVKLAKAARAVELNGQCGQTKGPSEGTKKLPFSGRSSSHTW